MIKLRIVIFILFLAAINTNCYAQDKGLTWKELGEQYEFPKWYTEARFGIWAHWGAQTEPRLGGGWYARHMYMRDVGDQTWGENAYPYHCGKYGHPSEKGFKDVIHEWKAENLDTDALMKYFKKIGAKYFVVLANHHDHFDNFNSAHHPWNSVNVGPKRDIVGEFEASAEKYDMPFGVSSHDDRFLNWWLPAFGADSTGLKKGVPYDGHMTKADGKGKWWEGLDPADLYGLPPEKRTPEWVEGVKHNWMLRHKELVTKYDVDMLWFDGHGFPYKKYGKEVCRTFFNHKLNKEGDINAVIAGKISNEPSIVKDIERGGSNEILHIPWQGTLTFNSWFYKEDRPVRHNARTVIEMLTDIISKNGNLLLNVELLPDGTIPPDHKTILDDIGEWINLNSKAIYACEPWKVYGDNLNSYLKRLEKEAVSEADLEALKEQANSEHFNERTIESPQYGPEEVRFTTKGDVLYIFVLNPEKGEIELPSLGLNSEYNPGKIRSVNMLGNDSKIRFKQSKDTFILTVPGERPNEYTTVFEVKGAL
ncbi:MAG: alpha-L-fucosidase [Bacteroidales bacterium]|nr:alpha-L-fucosidase [Bacteroidales bacterium]